MTQVNWTRILDDYSLVNIDQDFQKTLSKELLDTLLAYREGKEVAEDFLLSLAQALEQYVIRLFNIEGVYQECIDRLSGYDALQTFHKTISKPAIRALKVSKIEVMPQYEIMSTVKGLREEDAIAKMLAAFSHSDLTKWCQYVWQKQLMPFIHWQVFTMPTKLNYSQLVKVETFVPRYNYQYIGSTIAEKAVIHQVNYCIDCHFKDNDSCSKGLWDKRAEAYKVSPLGRVLMGCPLNQKISQMHVLRKQHSLIAALAITMLDNPLCIVTGDRICNDCMAACIYQKFEPVDTPSVESDTLAQVLALPYGAEIYLLLAKWNPMLQEDYLPQLTYRGSAAVIGMGPAGFAMSYYLLRKGAKVVGFDGLPIRETVGDVHSPIKDFYTWAEGILQAGPLGFGGVVEYGITARWDKRKLALVWALLHRFSGFSVMGNMRLGGAVTIPRLKAIGFEQVVLATGAGLPVAHNLQRHSGMMFANEFLMKLQITGLMHQTLKEGMEMPMAVVGGGLTAIDCATEALVYYMRWVEQVAYWFSQVSPKNLLSEVEESQHPLIMRWQEHGEHIRQLRLGKCSDAIKQYVQKIGGVKILYRRSMQESPAYRTNYLELQKALEQGVEYIENCHLESVDTEKDAVSALNCRVMGERKRIPVKTVFFATGSKPNVAYHYEHRSELMIENGYYKRKGFYVDSALFPEYVSVIGDLHPEYQGSVVGALASAKDSYAKVAEGFYSKRINEDALLGLKIQVIRQEVVLGYIRLTIATDLTLPLGGYVKVLIREEGVLHSLSGVIVSQTEVWIRQNASGSQSVMEGSIVGVLGPSGTRCVSQHVADNVLIVADHTGLAWALAILNSVRDQNKKATLLFKGDVPKFMHALAHEVITEVDSSQDWQEYEIFYCIAAQSLQSHPLRQVKCLEAHAVVDGPMMCYLKGVCGQCIQWQVSDTGEPLKAVYACSWPVQPLSLIDVGHYQKRIKENRLGSLYKAWQQRIKQEA